MSNLYTAIAAQARARGNAPAFDCGTEQYSYADVLGHTSRYATALQQAGVTPGDRVVVQLDKRIDGVWVYLAVLCSGAVYVPLNTGYTDAELDYFIGDAEPRLVVVEPARRAAISELTTDCAAEVTTVEELAASCQRSQVPSQAELVNRAPEDLAAILYTSGTTGRSKGAMLSHANLETNARVLVDAWGFSTDDRLLHVLPIYHVHGLFVALHCALLSGAQTLFEPRFDAPRVIALLTRATVFMGVPTYYTRLLAKPGFPGASNTTRLYISGSAPLLTETFEAFEARSGQRILERYGMTEAGMICSNPLTGTRVAGSVGAPLEGVALRVRAADGNLCPAGVPGSLEIAGPNVFSGYWRNPEKTAESFSDDGFFITGDLATQDEQGIVSIVGREKDLIISGGLNVYPKEVETELDGLAGVNESAVIGLSHPDFGEAVTAVVDAADEALDESYVIAALRHSLAGFKVPKRVVFVDALPRNAMGKVQKNLLREQFKETFRA